MSSLVALSLVASLYNEEPTELGMRAQYGDNLYIYGQYEAPEIRVVGQGLSDSEIYSVGLGARKDLGDFFIFGEFGYGYIENDIAPQVEQEVVYTHLVSRHNVYNRPVPVDQSDFNTSYDLSGGLLGAIGAGWQVTPHVDFSVAYRAFYGKERYKLWSPSVVAKCDCWWQETNSRDLSSFEFRISYNF